MEKNKDENSEYDHALKQIERQRKAVVDSFQHEETMDALIKSLSKRSDFAPLIITALVKNAYFWVKFLVVIILAVILIVKFPEVATWVLSLIISKNA